VRYIFADELHCFPPESIEAELEQQGLSYVQLLERISAVLAQKPAVFFREVAKSLPSYWQVFVAEQYPDDVKSSLLASLANPDDKGLSLWEQLAPYVLKKATTLAVETIVYERQEWVQALLKNWNTVSAQLSELPVPMVAKRPMLGMLLEGMRYLNKIQLLAVDAAQKEARARGESVPFGEMAIRKGFLAEERLNEVLSIQEELAVELDSPKRLGFYLLEAGVVSPTQLRDALLAQRATAHPLGQVLVQQGAIELDLLDTLLEIQRQERITSFAQEAV
jgi:hypothetical protein